jgi:hypothetical protein
VWQFLAGATTQMVKCPAGAEADTMAALVAAIRAARAARIVVVAPTRGAVVDTAVRLGSELGADTQGGSQVGIGIHRIEQPAAIEHLHPADPVSVNVVPVRSITAARAFGPECDLMIVTGVYLMPAMAVSEAARNAARLMILCPSVAGECHQPAAHDGRDGNCLEATE